MTLRPFVTAGVLGALAVLIGCGGGGGGGSPAPRPPVVPPSVTPATLAFSTLGTQSFQITQSGYTGKYSLSSSNAQIATVPSSETATGGATFVTVQAVDAGSATITVTDSQGRAATVAIVVTLTPVTVSLHGRAP